jgi:hypothetical protein
VSYSTEIAKLLADQLTKFATLTRHQLAEQVANLDFWLAEVRHCLEVIDGYRARFQRLKAALTRYVAEHDTVQFAPDDPCIRWSPTPPRRVPAEALGEARRSVGDAAYRFLVRCFREGLIEASAVRQACDSLGIGVEACDLRARR